jgi:hypothetical protein
LSDFAYKEINGGVVKRVSDLGALRFHLSPVASGYADAQIDDYSAPSSAFHWHPGTHLSLRARFSATVDRLQGTAGFGFWNAPFGPGTRRLPALPQAVWFFFGSGPTDLPLAPPPHGGAGWFASTIDAGTRKAIRWLPFAPLVLFLNQFADLRRRLWPWVQRDLAISFANVGVDIMGWHQYELLWRATGCFFYVDDTLLLATPAAPRGPLGFVCWIDNQYLRVTADGRFRWGTIATEDDQWLEIDDLRLARVS